MSSVPTAALPISVLIGSAFGFALEKGQVALPRRIVGQFLLTDFAMLKMFLSAAATSLAINIACSIIAPSTLHAVRKYNMTSGTKARTVAGAAVLGAGMALSGACPGTVLAQLGMGNRQAMLVAASAMVGVYLFSKSSLSNAKAVAGYSSTPVEKRVEAAALERQLGVSFGQAGSSLLAALVAVIAAVEWYAPYQPTVSDTVAASFFARQTWSPIVAGIVVGLNQLPAMLLLGRSIGSSSAYCTLTGSACSMVSKVPEYLQNYRGRGADSWWQPMYLAGAVGGAYLSASLSGSDLLWSTPQSLFAADAPNGGLGFVLSAAGGVLILLGARIAGGCTSGIGISLFSQLLSPAIESVAAMFGAAIVTANVVAALGLYPGFVTTL